MSRARVKKTRAATKGTRTLGSSLLRPTSAHRERQQCHEWGAQNAAAAPEISMTG